MDNAKRCIHVESSSFTYNKVDSIDTRSKRGQTHLAGFAYITEASLHGCEKRRLALQPREKGI